MSIQHAIAIICMAILYRHRTTNMDILLKIIIIIWECCEEEGLALALPS